MNVKQTGQRVLRWVAWAMLAWVFVRGIASFFPAHSAPTPAASSASVQTAAEPPGLRVVPVLFAQDFLTWRATDPQEHAERIRAYLAGSLDPQAGWAPQQQSTTQGVTGAWTYATRQLSATRWLVTVAVRVTPTRDGKPLPETLLYVGVPVGVTAEGGLTVYDYPTLMPAPVPGDFTEPLAYGTEAPDQDGKVKALLDGFFRSFLGSGDITYYLTADARLRSAHSPWTYQSLGKVTLVQNGAERWALADVNLADPATGATYTCRYTLGLREQDGRWYISQLSQKGD